MAKKPALPAGILPSQSLTGLVGTAIRPAAPLLPGQIQPASLDLRLGKKAYRVRASFLPGPDATVADKIGRYSLYELDLTGGAVLERGCVYIVPLLEGLRLPADLAGVANPKSSAGRLDIFTRLIADRSSDFDRVAAGYRGPLYAEISPRTFGVRVRTGTRLSQLRLRRGPAALATTEGLKTLHAHDPLIGPTGNKSPIRGGHLDITIDLAGHEPDRLIGYRAKQDTVTIDFDRIGAYEPLDFWEPIFARNADFIVLNLDDFYILASKEPVSVPPDYAAEMVPYDTNVGEFRVHYAGFFDPGFGHATAGGTGSRAVLEVRPHEVPFIIEDGQRVGRLAYEKLAGRPAQIYGQGIGSNYQAQGLRLSKHFKQG